MSSWTPPLATFRLHRRSLVVPALGLAGGVVGATALVFTDANFDPRVFFVIVPAVVRMVQIVTMTVTIDHSNVRATWGWLWTSDKTIPLDRVQDVEIQRSLMARILGLTQVEISSAGGGGSIKLSYFDAPDAEAFRNALARAGLERHPEAPAPAWGAQFAAPGLGAPPVAAVAAEYRVHEVDGTEILRSVAPGAILTAASLVVGLPLAIMVHPALLLPGVALLLLTALSAATTWLTIGPGESSTTSELLRVRQGVLTLRTTSTPRTRIQIVSAVAGPAFQLLGFEKIQYASADAQVGKGEGVRSVLTPGLPRRSIHRFTGPLIGVEAPEERQLRSLGSRVLRSSTSRAVLTSLGWASAAGAVAATTAAVLGILGSLDDTGVGRSIDSTAATRIALLAGLAALPVIVVVGAVVGVFVGVVRQARSRFGLDADALEVIDGVWKLRTKVVPLSKVQAIDVARSPVQRWCGTSSVEVDIAGLSGRWTVRLVDVDAGVAEDLARYLTAAASSSALPDGV